MMEAIMLRSMEAPTRRLRIGEVAELCGLTRRAIRFYEDRGLISVEREENGVRVYDPATIESLRQIAFARQAGLGMRELAELRDIGASAGATAQRLRMAELCRARAADLEAQRRHLERVAEDVLRDMTFEKRRSVA